MPPINISDNDTSPTDKSDAARHPGTRATSSHCNVEPEKLREMQQALPDSTNTECQRFLADRCGDTKAAITKLTNYLSWRERHCSDDARHSDPWTHASQLAMETSGEGGRATSAQTDGNATTLPCTIILQEHEQSTANASGSGADALPVNGKKYFQFLPARIDTNLADTSVYALALAIFIDGAFDRHSAETATLVIDVRSGRGWANIKATRLLPFIKSTARLLCDLYPRRLERCVVFPVPAMAQALWKAARPFLGKDARERVCLVAGSAGRDDGAPEKLGDYLDAELIAKFEKRRTDCFVT